MILSERGYAVKERGVIKVGAIAISIIIIIIIIIIIMYHHEA